MDLEERINNEACGAHDRYTGKDCAPWDNGEHLRWQRAVRPLVTRIVELEGRPLSNYEGLLETRAALDARDGESAKGAARRVMARVKELEQHATTAASTIVELRAEIARVGRSDAAKDTELAHAAFTIGKLQAMIADQRTAISVLSGMVGRGHRGRSR